MKNNQLCVGDIFSYKFHTIFVKLKCKSTHFTIKTNKYYKRIIMSLDIVNNLSSTFNADIVKLNYYIATADYDTWGNWQTLSDSDTYKNGISLSSVKWGFFNPGAISGDVDAGNISFTLHDIAGNLINEIIKIRRGGRWIYFMGPDNLGNLWGGPPAIYIPIEKDCSIEFSAIQGFTYTITGRPMYQAAKTQLFCNKQAFTITGSRVDIGADFGTYLLEDFVPAWNEFLKKYEKPEAMIALDLGDSEIFKNPVATPIKNKDGALGKIEPFEVYKEETLSDAIKRLYNSRFKKHSDDVETSDKGAAKSRVIFDIGLMEWAGKKSKYHVHIIDGKSKFKTDSGFFQLCVGDDDNCRGQFFRGSISQMNFGALLELLYPNASQDGSEDQSQAGNTKFTPKKGVTKMTGRDETQEKTLEQATNASSTVHAGHKWASVATLLASRSVPEFTIDINMPYTFAFTPKAHGGNIIDGIENTISSTINAIQGVDLSFYWYSDATCQVLLKQEGISGTYRLAKVIHEIGSVNSTQISLSHEIMS